MKSTIQWAVLMLLIHWPAQIIYADAKTSAAREAAEYIFKKFGSETTKEGVEVLTRRIEVFVTKYGEEFIIALKKVGPRAFGLVEEAATHGGDAIKVMARFGEDGAVWIVTRPRGMAIFLKYGDSAAEALVKHKDISEPIIEQFGAPAVRALDKIGPQNGRRLAQMAEAGDLIRTARSPELLGVLGNYGDPAMEFIWKHKGALSVTAVLARFLADPKPFLDGVENIATPLAQAPEKIAEEVVRRVNWTPIVALLLCLLAILGGIQLLRRRRTESHRTENAAQQ